MVMAEWAVENTVLGRSPVCGMWCIPRLNQTTLQVLISTHCLGVQVGKDRPVPEGGRGDGDFLHVLLVEGLAIKVFCEIHDGVCWVKYVKRIRRAGLRVLLPGHVEVVVCVVDGVLGK